MTRWGLDFRRVAFRLCRGEIMPETALDAMNRRLGIQREIALWLCNLILDVQSGRLTGEQASKMIPDDLEFESGLWREGVSDET